jgi:hypothetical protein
MLKPISKRSYPRFQVPGATIALKDELHPVISMGRGGLSFLAKDKFRPGRKLSFQLMLSKKEAPLQLIGSVVYCIPSSVVNNGHNVGIRFAPFSKSKGHNLPEISGILERLENRHVPPASQRNRLFP